MDVNVADWALETTSTVGPDTVIFDGPVSNHASFNVAFPESTNVWYSIESENGDRECGRGFFDKSINGLVRSTVDCTLVAGEYKVYPNAVHINLVGTSKVGCTLNAKAMQIILQALATGALRGVKVFGPQTETPVGAVAGDFWLVP